MHTLQDLRSGQLIGSQHLRLSDALSEFPTEIFDLADTLEILDLSGTGLSSLPDDLPQLKKLRIIFCSNNPFDTLPEVLGDCPSLTMVGFKACQIRHVPENAIPKNTNWLILTDNQVSELPANMGRLTRLQKVMLAGNQLSDLPDSMANCRNIELLRLSANRFERIPDFVFGLPRLSWLTFAGNSLHLDFEETADLPLFSRDQIEILEKLGEGASGVISKARWLTAPEGVDADQVFAFKDFKGAVTSDGFAKDELGASLAAGHHEGLVQILARTGPEEPAGLAMSLIPPDFQTLGNPPSFETCTRDWYDKGQALSPNAALKIARRIASVMLHLRMRGICHNDLYAHNILVNDEAEALLTDFGAAANYASLPAHQAEALEHIETRAFGCLLEDLLGLVPADDAESPLVGQLSDLKDQCLSDAPADRPDLSELTARLEDIGPHQP